MTYKEMAEKAKTCDSAARAEMAHVLLRIYEADRTKNIGLVNGEAILSQSFASEAKAALKHAGVL